MGSPHMGKKRVVGIVHLPPEHIRDPVRCERLEAFEEEEGLEFPLFFLLRKRKQRGWGAPRSSSVICFRPQKEKKFRSFPEKLKRLRELNH